MPKNVKWGKNNAEKLLIGDFNQDGRDDVFALGKQQNKNNIPLAMAPGVAGVAPQLALNYSSQNNVSGPLGVGW